MSPGQAWNTIPCSDVALCAAGLKKITAGQARTLSWLNFARRCCSLPLHRSRWTTEAASEAAEALTRHKPFTVGVETLRLQVKPLSITYLAHNAFLNGKKVPTHNPYSW